MVDRQPGPALETSFGNAGELSYGYASPWAGPGIPLKAIKWLTMVDGPLVIRPMLDPRMWLWGLSLLANCTERAYAINKSRMVRLAEYSNDRMVELRQLPGGAFRRREQGTLQLFRTQKQLDHIHGDVEVLKHYGVPYEVLDPAGCVAVEPGLATAQVPFVGALRLPNDDTGDCRMFTECMSRLATDAGVTFHLRHDGQRHRDRRRQGQRRFDQPRHAGRRCLCRRHGQLYAAAGRAARHQAAGLSDQGLFAVPCRSPTRAWRRSRP